MVRCSTCNVFHMRQFCRFFYCLAWSDTVEFNCRPCLNDKMDDDADFVDQFHYQLTIFGNRVLIGLSRILRGHIANELYTAKIIAEFCRIFYCLYDLIRFNSIVCHVQTTRCTMIYIFRWSIQMPIDYVWCLLIDRAISTLRYSYCIWNSYIKKNTTANRHDAGNDLSCRAVVKCKFRWRK